MTRWLWVAAVIAGLSLVGAPAQALEDYADEIARELELADKPSCLFCHARDVEFMATDTLFNDALKDRGFSRRKGLPSLRAALADLDADATDSDQGGDADVDELRQYANPNDPADDGVAKPSCSIASRGAGVQPWWLAWTALAITWRVRRRTFTGALRPVQRARGTRDA